MSKLSGVTPMKILGVMPDGSTIEIEATSLELSSDYTVSYEDGLWQELVATGPVMSATFVGRAHDDAMDTLRYAFMRQPPQTHPANLPRWGHRAVLIAAIVTTLAGLVVWLL